MAESEYRPLETAPRNQQIILLGSWGAGGDIQSECWGWIANSGDIFLRNSPMHRYLAEQGFIAEQWREITDED